jgi:hypothetical protein
MKTLLRLSMCLGVLGVSAVPVSAQEDAPLAPIVGDWERHGFFVSIDDDGSSSASWRVYVWCGPGVPDPCDTLASNRIYDGGHADITFSGPDESGVFQGEVLNTSDPETLDVGPLTLTLQDYGMALLQQGDNEMTVCGPHFLELAPESVRFSGPCGA